MASNRIAREMLGLLCVARYLESRPVPKSFTSPTWAAISRAKTLSSSGLATVAFPMAARRDDRTRLLAAISFSHLEASILPYSPWRTLRLLSGAGARLRTRSSSVIFSIPSTATWAVCSSAKLHCRRTTRSRSRCMTAWLTRHCLRESCHPSWLLRSLVFNPCPLAVVSATILARPLSRVIRFKGDDQVDGLEPSC